MNYHIHKPERQAFELDAVGFVGNLISPELMPTKIHIQDLRHNEPNPSFEQASLEYAAFHTDVDVLNNELACPSKYDADIKRFLKDKLDIDEVFIFDHTVRIDDEHSELKTARNVHSDYSEDGAQQRLVDLLLR